MSYVGIILLVSRKVGPWIDKLGSTKKALMLGNLPAGCALMLMAVAVVMNQQWLMVTMMTLAMQLLIWFGVEQAMFVLVAFFIFACVLFAFFDENSTKEVCA
ncbi:MAG: hypothetical protein ACI8UC_000739 [Psychromonas sp.]|jgi:hypothetical protein